MNAVIKYLLFIGGCVAAYFEPIAGITLVVVVLFVLDFFTGIGKALKSGDRIRSGKLKWSLYKLLTYLGVMTLTFFISESMGLGRGTGVAVVKVEVWFIIYIEGLSIIENLQVIKDNRYLQFIHYLLAVEFLKKFAVLGDFLKEEAPEGGEG
jgi:phage-related holin